MLFAFGISKSLAQSSLFQRDNYSFLEDQIDREVPPEIPDNPTPPGGGGENPPPDSPLGSGIAILLGCATLYACTRRKKEN